MKNKINYLFLALIGSAYCMLMVSCKKTLESFDDSVQETSKVLSTPQGINAAITGIYDIMQDVSYYGGNYLAISDVMGGTERVNPYGRNWIFFGMHQVATNNDDVLKMWNTIYLAINSTNYIIDAAPNIKNTNGFNINAAIGESRCLRALFYFDLLRYFGGGTEGYNKVGGVGVPLWLTPTKVKKDATPKPRATEAQVYTQIINDLDFAITNLSPLLVNGKVNQNVALAIKARVQLYRGEWADAELSASQVIKTAAAAAPNGGLVLPYANLWQQKNQKPESIWVLQFSPDDPNSIERNFFPGYWKGVFLGGNNFLSVSTGLIQAHEAGDIRMGVNFGNSIPPINPAIPDGIPLKFGSILGDDNAMLLRLAELYLIRAEARVRKATPDITGALADINLIRSRAMLPNTAATNVADIMTAIEKERRIELAFEGDIWFDLRRYNKLSTIGVTEPFRALLPIPQREIDNSGGIIAQNADY